MARSETKTKATSATRVFNIINLFRGNIAVPSKPAVGEADPVGSAQLLSAEKRSQILGKAFQALPPGRTQSSLTPAGLMTIVQSSIRQVGNARLENRKILQLMPEIDKAARLMIASTLSPNDLSRHQIPNTFTDDLSLINI